MCFEGHFAYGKQFNFLNVTGMTNCMETAHLLSVCVKSFKPFSVENYWNIMCVSVCNIIKTSSIFIVRIRS